MWDFGHVDSVYFLWNVPVWWRPKDEMFARAPTPVECLHVWRVNSCKAVLCEYWVDEVGRIESDQKIGSLGSQVASKSLNYSVSTKKVRFTNRRTPRRQECTESQMVL